ncbi:MAG: hypothetical protein ACNI3C_08950 [Candidatus Marinarcus sp.]|uniref:hypothetical protein n=1 Tax=Candidatus Marinarcus sp. TaxID=3100987 RepID=UPI003B007F43
MKNILCICSNPDDAINFETLKQYFTEYHYDIVKTFNEVSALFTSKSYEVVVIDFTKPEGKEILDFIMSKNDKQKIITMSENLECSVVEGCNHCFTQYNRRRILQPIKLKELISTIKNFDEIACSYKNQFSNIINILDKIISGYSCFEYDCVNQVISPKESSFGSSIIQELIEITKLLTEKNICFSVDKNFSISIINENNE